MVVRSIDYELCINCGKCYRICPMNVYRQVEDLVYIAHQKDCMSCFLCVMDCPQKAITVDGRRGTEIPYPY